jgi:hypothetical protein
MPEFVAVRNISDKSQQKSRTFAVSQKNDNRKDQNIRGQQYLHPCGFSRHNSQIA